MPFKVTAIIETPVNKEISSKIFSTKVNIYDFIYNHYSSIVMHYHNLIGPGAAFKMKPILSKKNLIERIRNNKRSISILIVQIGKEYIKLIYQFDRSEFRTPKPLTVFRRSKNRTKV